MRLFDKLSGKCEELEQIFFRMKANTENNYKDAAQSNFQEFVSKYDELKAAGKLNKKQLENYSGILEEYRQRMEKFRHKDQTPYWT